MQLSRLLFQILAEFFHLLFFTLCPVLSVLRQANTQIICVEVQVLPVIQDGGELFLGQEATVSSLYPLTVDAFGVSNAGTDIRLLAVAGGVGLQPDVPQCIRHRFERATATVDAERHCPVLVSSDPLDERVLHPGISQVVDERVTEAVEGLPWVSDAQTRLVATEPLRRGMAQLAPDGFQFREEAVCSSGL